MQQIPAFAGRKLVLFAFAAILLIWGILALDWWSINSHSSTELDGSSGEFMGVDAPSWGFLLFAIGLVATLLIVEGCRLLFGVREQANRQFALQRRMIDHAAEAMILTDAAQRILTVNAAFEQTTGYRASEVLGLTPTKLCEEHHGLNFHRNV